MTFDTLLYIGYAISALNLVWVLFLSFHRSDLALVVRNSLYRGVERPVMWAITLLNFIPVVNFVITIIAVVALLTLFYYIYIYPLTQWGKDDK